MVLYRNINNFLDKWLTTNLGLFVDGARQVGKTYILKKYGKEHFKKFIYINLIEQKDYVDVLSESKNANDFILRLRTLVSEEMPLHETCIFIDEIQEFQDFDIVTIMKFLVEEGSYRFMLSGSLLGIALYNVNSWPVGYMATYTMHPLTFFEYAKNRGMQEDTYHELEINIKNKKVLPEYLHKKFLEIFDEYMIIGGMPQIVDSFISNNDISNLDVYYDAINSLNKKDIMKYAQLNKKLKIQEIYDLIPSELNSQTKRFILKDVENKSINDNMQSSFLWLANAGVIIPVYNVEEPKFPLKLSASRTLLKVFMEDVGLLSNTIMNNLDKIKLINKEINLNYGSLYENFVACEFKANKKNDLYYYSNKKKGELDFVIENNGEVIPIEVKSGKKYDRHSALTNIMSVENYNIKKSVVLSRENYKNIEKIEYIPIYAISIFLGLGN